MVATVAYFHIAGGRLKDRMAFPAVGRLTPAIEAASHTPVFRLNRQFGELDRRREGGNYGSRISRMM